MTRYPRKINIIFESHNLPSRWKSTGSCEKSESEYNNKAFSGGTWPAFSGYAPLRSTFLRYLPFSGLSTGITSTGETTWLHQMAVQSNHFPLASLFYAPVWWYDFTLSTNLANLETGRCTSRSQMAQVLQTVAAEISRGYDRNVVVYNNRNSWGVNRNHPDLTWERWAIPQFCFAAQIAAFWRAAPHPNDVVRDGPRSVGGIGSNQRPQGLRLQF